MRNLGDQRDGGVQIVSCNFVTHVVKLCKPWKFCARFRFLMALDVAQSDLFSGCEGVHDMHELHFNINIWFQVVVW